MQQSSRSIRPFIGCRNFEVSRNFYRDLGFEEVVISAHMSLFRTENVGFYLQDAFVQDWIDNTMIFLEVQNVQNTWDDLVSLNLPDKYKDVRLTPIRVDHWGRECFVHDPSGILWHFGEFFNKS
jgi:catechol 2,3-dioxygenase-like lactoylglutathione lyase family enzyme